MKVTTLRVLPIVLLVLGVLVYVPGINGPFFFDDYSNILGNTYIRIQHVSLESLYQAAFSLTAGPLQRPVAMASFALNYFFSGSFNNAYPFKLTNIVIHAINGLLIYWLLRLVFSRAAKRSEARKDKIITLSAAFVALLWLIHPIQLSSVLYVVQRMTELAGLFTLLGLIAYLKARLCFIEGKTTHGLLLIAVAFGVCWPLGLYSKEIALLLPVFMLVFEYTLFSGEAPWKRWKKLTRHTQHKLIALALLASAALLAGSIVYTMPNYAVRTFTLIERIMTEPRVLFFYLSLMTVPRLDAFGLFHDDITVSTSLFSPWTTLPSILGIIALLIAGLATRRKYPLLSFGILWFFAGHLLESTVFALEIAHEHRNYLPSLGIFIACFEAGRIVLSNVHARYTATVAATILIGFAAITVVRASQWSKEDSMAYYEAIHRPDSAASQSRYANLLLAQGRFEESLVAARRAADLAPNEPSYLIGIVTVESARGSKVDPADDLTIRERLSSRPISASTLYELSDIGNCVTRECKSLQPYLEGWMQALLANPRAKDASYSYFLLGRALLGQGKIDEAIEAYMRAYDLDNNYIHPLLDLTEIYLYHGRADYAEVMLNQIRLVNARTVHKRDAEIARLEARVAALKEKQRKENQKN